MSWRKVLYEYLSDEVQELLAELDPVQASAVEEIRFRIGSKTEIVIDGCSHWIGDVLDSDRMNTLLAALSGYALYRCERELSRGYIPLTDGHRAGVCGKMTYAADGTFNMHEITSICLRIARFLPDADTQVRPWIFEGGRTCSLLFLGPPGCGKTTVLRSCALYLSDDAGMHVCVVDEKEELFGGCERNGVYRLDVLRGMSKAQAMPMLIRNMAPQVIVVDEIGLEADVEAVRDAARCGIAVLASAHASCMEDVKARPSLRPLFEEGIFDRYVLLGRKGRVISVWSKAGERMHSSRSDKDGKLEFSCNGHDFNKCAGLSDF